MGKQGLKARQHGFARDEREGQLPQVGASLTKAFRIAIATRIKSISSWHNNSMGK